MFDFEIVVATQEYIKTHHNDADEFNMIITDWDCAEEQIAALEDTGIKVIVAEESK